MQEFIVTDKSGRVIESGDTVVSFRGEEWIFNYVTRGVEYNGTAKVYATDLNGYSMELYDRVFNLKVETVSS